VVPGIHGAVICLWLWFTPQHFIAEMLRAVLGGEPWPNEAAKNALVLRMVQTLRLVVIPSGLRVSHSALTSHTLNITKNSFVWQLPFGLSGSCCRCFTVRREPNR